MKHLLLPAILVAVFLSSCQKSELSQNPVPSLSSNDKEAGASLNAVAGTYTLTLQPGPKDGDDLWMKNWIGHPSYADTCDYTVALIKGLVAYLDNSLLYTRSVIKFDSLSKIPAGANLLSAKLYLYGPSPTSKDVKKHLPTGNSSYPGSDKPENSCFLQRITNAWDKSTISWNNPPATTTDDQYLMQPSNKQWKYDVALDVTNLVRPMLAAGANNGFLLRLQTEDPGRALGFLSADSPEAKRRPKLVVTYSL